MDYFVNPEDLKGWIKSQPSGSAAATKITELLGDEPEKGIADNCKAIFENDDEKAASVLFGTLAKHNLTQVKTSKDGDKMQKTAQTQPESRQRNDWVRGMRNKWNRVVHGFNEGTPWRIDRDKMFNFTHYYTDALSFDEDPNKVYSGEAIWRMYIMDKFTREYMNKEGKWVGGYINDRFYVFPDAGTPANPKVARDGGNQMGLPPGVKSRKPRPHQYSTERRLEEARGNKGDDLEAFANQNNTLIKVASKNVPEKENDKVYSIFKDVLDMREAGIAYDTMLEKVAEHYGTSILNVAQIDQTAQKLRIKHAGIAYEMQKTAVGAGVQPAALGVAPVAPLIVGKTYAIQNPEGAKDVSGNPLKEGVELNYTGKNPSGQDQFQITSTNQSVVLADVKTANLVDAEAEKNNTFDELNGANVPDTKTGGFPVTDMSRAAQPAQQPAEAQGQPAAQNPAQPSQV